MPKTIVATSASGRLVVEAHTIFQPLQREDSIRILELSRIDPGQRELHGRLVNTQLCAKPNYSALSYAWGNDPPTKSILMSGKVPYPITETLFDALQEVLRSETILLWVDQICFDQEDVNEKAHQVSLMGQIYRQARQVIAWLGASTPNSDIAVRVLSYVAECRAPEPDGGNECCESAISVLIEDFRSMSLDSLEKICDISNPVWQALISLAKRPWFSRLWVVQEAVLSKELLFRCGESIISGNAFFVAVEAISQLPTFPPKPVFAAFENARKIGTLRANHLSNCDNSYLELAHQLSEWDCRDDRDRLHSIAGLVHRDTRWFTPSYTLKVEELFEDFAKRHILQTKSLAILRLAGDSRIYVMRDTVSSHILVPPGKPFQICSWAPDWRIKTRPKPLRLMSEGNNGFEAAKFSEMENPFDHSSKILRVQASMVAEVAILGPPLVKGIHPGLSVEAVLCTWFKIAKMAFPRAKDIEERFAALLVMNDLNSGKERILTNFKRWASAIFIDVDKPRDLSDAEWISQRQNPIQHGIDGAARYGLDVMEVCRYRSFFITKCGKLGLGPAQVLSSSLVYMIRGLTLPFLLQKASEGDNHYYLRGECYVEGLMDSKNRNPAKDDLIYLI